MTHPRRLIATSALVFALFSVLAGASAAQNAAPPPPAGVAPPPNEPVLGRPQPAPPTEVVREIRQDDGRTASDTEPATVRATPEAALDELRADPDFQYDKPVAERPSLWDRFWLWVGQNLIAPFFARSATQGGRTIWFIIAALILVAVLLRVFRADLGGIFGKSGKSSDDGQEPLLDVENIADADLRTLLARALESGAYRDVVRLRYLIVLQTLAARGAIEWARDKTNTQYVAEVRGGREADISKPFAEATRVFDYVWYGGLEVDEARYASLVGRFDRLDEALSVPSGRSQRVRT